MFALFCFDHRDHRGHRGKIGKLGVLRALCGEFLSGATKSAKVVSSVDRERRVQKFSRLCTLMRQQKLRTHINKLGVDALDRIC
jgi:hypothetical protein